MKSYFYDKALTGLYQEVGGIEAFRGISKRFHDKVEKDPVLRALFPKNMASIEERLALYLAERTGGPPSYSDARGKASLLCRHAHLAIGTAEADLWLAHMAASLAEEGIEEQVASRLLANLSELAATLADPLILLYHLPLEALRVKLEEDPSLARVNDHGRNLLCAAAISRDVPRLRLLLDFGADLEAKDIGGHNALYRVANGGGHEEDGRAAVELLVANGADVNQITGVGRMTPLHMAARRGSVAVADALLSAGAQLEARDAKGETPLRRAVNCGQVEVVKILLYHGADPLSRDRFGRTIIDVGRGDQMRDILLGRG